MLSSESIEAHSGICSAIGFVSSDQIVSASDDHKIILRDLHEKKVITTFDLGNEVYPIDLAILGGTKKIVTIAIGSTDGKVSLFSLSAGQLRPEKKWSAHQGACIQCSSSPNGTEILTCGEDGTVKVWSKSGLLRTTLASSGQAIYAAAWSPDGTHVVFTQGNRIQIKSLQPNTRNETWNAHSALITALAWGSSDIIGSGGEEGKYKLWDKFGRSLYSSQSVSNQPISAISFSPNNDTVLVGTFGVVLLCDQSGSIISSIHDSAVGSPFRLAWCTDGRVAVAGTGSGKTMRIDVCGMEAEDTSHNITQVSPKKIEVNEVENSSLDIIETTDRILSMSLGFRHIICITTKEILVFTKGRMNTPQLIQHRDINIKLVKQAPNNFLVLDGLGVTIYSYEGRVQSQSKYNFSLNSLQSNQVAINGSYCLLTDPRDHKHILGFETPTGKALNAASSNKSSESNPVIQHKSGVRQITIQQESKIFAFLDDQKEAFIADLEATKLVVLRLLTNAEAISFSTSLPVLGFLRDSYAHVILNPAVIYKDTNLIGQSIVSLEMEPLGQNSTFIGFTESMLRFKNSDGSIIRTIIPVYAQLLLERLKQKKLQEAMNVCRMTNESYLWAVLGGYCLEKGDISIMNECFSYLGHMDKLDQIDKIGLIENKAQQLAEVRLLGNDKDAAQIVLKQSSIFQQIQMQIAQNKWSSALAIAVKNESHVDSVLYLRRNHLKKREKEESEQKFIEMNQNIDFEWADIKTKIAQETQ